MINAVIALVVLCLALTGFYHLLETDKKKNTIKLKKLKIKPVSEPVPAKPSIDYGVYAAIATAIHLYGEELHDVENAVLTINKVSRTYSPWSSKIHGLNTYFRR